MGKEAAPPIQGGFLEGRLEGLGVWELLLTLEDRCRSLGIPRWERLGAKQWPQPWYPPTPSHLAFCQSRLSTFQTVSLSVLQFFLNLHPLPPPGVLEVCETG